MIKLRLSRDEDAENLRAVRRCGVEVEGPIEAQFEDDGSKWTGAVAVFCGCMWVEFSACGFAWVTRVDEHTSSYVRQNNTVAIWLKPFWLKVISVRTLWLKQCESSQAEDLGMFKLRAAGPMQCKAEFEKEFGGPNSGEEFEGGGLNSGSQRVGGF